MTESKRHMFISIRLPEKTMLLSMAVIAFALMGGIYLRWTWNAGISETTEQAVRFAMAAGTGFQETVVSHLEASPGDIEKTEYIQIKNSLTELADLKNDIRFAYLYTLKDGKIYFLADSELPGSGGYSPPGQQYSEAPEVYYQPFSEGRPLITGEITDRWGTWISVLVPVKEPVTGKVAAVFGVDYPYESWDDHAINRTLQAGAFVLCLFFILSAFYIVVAKNRALKDEKNKLAVVSKRLKESEELFRTVFEQSPIGIAVGSDYKLISNINRIFEKITGRSKEELTALSWTDITHPDDLQEDLDHFAKLMSGRINGYSMIKRFIKPDGSATWVKIFVSPLKFSNKNSKNHLFVLEDINEHIHAEQALRESERSKAVLLSNLPGMAYRCSYDRKWTMQFVSDGCFELTGYKPESLLHNRDLSFSDLIDPGYREVIWDIWARVLKSKTVFKDEYKITTASGETKWVYEQGQGIYDGSGRVQALEGLIIDITDRKKREEEIQYLNDHDVLTGIYNRRFFEKEKSRLDDAAMLPISVIIGDINGLKLINDAFGHAQGDKLIVKIAKIMKSCLRPRDVLARTGGDEFGILMPKTDSKTAYEVLGKIKRACGMYNKSVSNEAYYINVSLGYSTKTSAHEDFERVIKVAEDFMYRGKLLERKSLQSSIIASIKATMYERNQETEEHEERLIELSKRVGAELNLSQTELDDLELLATLHDIGKVGIDDRILNKPDGLTEEERNDIRKHPEIGYRIVMSSPTLVPIAEYVLCHHERWDGKGYPQGLRGEDIPVLSRIIAVVDAYDAMTEDRVYRKAMTKNNAVAELKKNAGTQFDPNIVEILIEKVLSER